MNYPVLRNRVNRARAWHALAIRFRLWRQADRLMACRSGWAGGTGANTTCNNRRVSGSVMPVVVFSPQPALFQRQEPQRQHHQCHVVVKATPPANLVVVQAYLLFAA